MQNPPNTTEEGQTMTDDTNRFDIALYLGSTTPLTIHRANAATLTDITNHMTNGDTFTITVTFPDRSMHAITVNADRVPWWQVDTGDAAAPLQVF